MTPPILLLISLAAGFVGSLGGMGGGILLIPVATLCGMEVKKAIALSMVSVIATSSGSGAAYLRDHLPNLKIAMFLEVFTMTGALAGAFIAVQSNPRILLLLLGIALLGSVAVLWSQRKTEWSLPPFRDSWSRWLELSGSYPDHPSGNLISYHATRTPWAGLGMFGAGLIAGLLGIGAGALKVLILDMIMGLPPKVSTTTSNLIIGVTALGGSSVYLSAGLIDPVVQYDHTEGEATVGGFVYRGSSITGLQGKYIFGDYTQDELGARFGISRSAVSMNVRGLRWK